jgi:hypothetical protein
MYEEVHFTFFWKPDFSALLKASKSHTTSKHHGDRFLHEKYIKMAEPKGYEPDSS